MEENIDYEAWFLSLDMMTFTRLCAKWRNANLEIPEDLQGYDQWLNYFKTLPPVEIRRLMKDGESILSTEAYAAVRRWADILATPQRIDKIYQAGLAKPKAAQESISDLAKKNDKLGILYAIRDEIAEKLDKGTGARDTANLAREMGAILDQISEAERRSGPKTNTKLAQLTKRSRDAGVRRNSYRAKTIKELEDGEA